MSNQDCTTFCVYRIVCFQNAMVYIGQTRNPEKRKRIHFQQLRDNYHVNIHLQAAYNKYGRQAFYFEVIERDISSTDIDAREQYWIATYDSFHNGFNRTPGGNHGGGSYKPVIWNGIWYESVSECSRILGISMTWRIAQGYTSDAEVKTPGDHKRKSFTWNGIQYRSYGQCAKTLGLDPSTIRDYALKGYTCDADVTKQEKPCVWNGIHFSTQAEAARACGVTRSVMATRIKQGLTCDADVPKRYKGKAKPFTYEGIVYESKSEYSRITGVSLSTLHYRLKLARPRKK